MKDMVEQQQLTMIISYLMEQLGVDKMKISHKDLKRIRNNDKYCGIKAENDKEDDDYIVLERIKVSDVKLEDLLRDLGRKLDRIKED
jgi:hypothetical protein